MKYIYFGAGWCGPCKTVKPLVITSGKNIQTVDTDTNQDLATKYNIRSIPTIVGVDGSGNVDERYSGAPAIMTFLKS